jgi:hypothetical protein
MVTGARDDGGPVGGPGRGYGTCGRPPGAVRVTGAGTRCGLGRQHQTPRTRRRCRDRTHGCPGTPPDHTNDAMTIVQGSEGAIWRACAFSACWRRRRPSWPAAPRRGPHSGRSWRPSCALPSSGMHADRQTPTPYHILMLHARPWRRWQGGRAGGAGQAAAGPSRPPERRRRPSAVGTSHGHTSTPTHTHRRCRVGGAEDAGTGLSAAIEYVRRERDLAVAALDVARAELERTRAEAAASARALDHARARLAEVRGYALAMKEGVYINTSCVVVGAGARRARVGGAGSGDPCRAHAPSGRPQSAAREARVRMADPLCVCH